MDFHGYLQWIAAEQFGAVRQLARELGLERRHLWRLRRGRERVGFGDLVRSDRCTAPAPPSARRRIPSDWAARSGAFRRRIRASCARTAYAPFVALVRASMRNCGALRLDHVMALFRQWWVPRGFKSADGGYVHYPLEDLLGVVALESHRHQCLVVGEDLGVVPDEIRRALPQFGVYHYKVVMFEQKNGEFVAPAGLRPSCARRRSPRTTCPRCTAGGAVMTSICGKSSVSMPTPSVGERGARGAPGGTRTAAARVAARETVARGSRGRGAGIFGRARRAPCTRTSAGAPRRWSPCRLEDMIGMLEPVNVPGTSSEYSNWTRRMTSSAREIFARADVRELCRRHGREP